MILRSLYGVVFLWGVILTAPLDAHVTILGEFPDEWYHLLDTTGLQSHHYVVTGAREVRLIKTVPDTLFGVLLSSYEQTGHTGMLSADHSTTSLDRIEVVATQTVYGSYAETMRFEIRPRTSIPATDQRFLKSYVLLTLDSIPSNIYQHYFTNANSLDSLRLMQSRYALREWNFAAQLGMDHWHMKFVLDSLPTGRDAAGEQVRVLKIEAICSECMGYGISLPRISQVDSVSRALYLEVVDRRKFLRIKNGLSDITLDVGLTIHIQHGDRTFKQIGLAVIHLTFE